MSPASLSMMDDFQVVNEEAVGIEMAETNQQRNKRSANGSDTEMENNKRKMRKLREPDLKRRHFHLSNLAANLWRMQDSGDFCDVEILVGPNKSLVLCHKNILVGSSQYFQKVFSYEKEGMVHQSEDGVYSSGEITDVVLKKDDVPDVDHNHGERSIIYVDKDGTDEISKEAVKATLRFIYCGMLPGGVDSIIPSIFSLADIWFLPRLKAICIEKMVRDVSVSNFQQMLRFAEKYNIEELSKVVQDFIPRYLPHIYQSKEFSELEEGDIKDMLIKPLTYHHDDLNCIKSLKSWCRNSPEKFHRFLEMVELEFFTKEQLQNVSNSSLVEEEDDFRHRVDTALKVGKEPSSVQYVPIMKLQNYLDANVKMNLGTVVDFGPSMVIAEPFRIDNSVIHQFVRPFADKCTSIIRFHSQVCYKNIIYASYSLDYSIYSSSLSLPLFTYCLVQGQTKAIPCDILDVVPDWNGKNLVKSLYLQDNILYCTVFNAPRSSFLVLKLDLDNKDSKWETVKLKEQDSYFLSRIEPRIIVVEQDAIWIRSSVHTGGIMENSKRQVILKLHLYNTLGPFDLREVTKFPFEGDGRMKTSDDLFYDCEGKRLFVFEHVRALGLGNLFVYNLATDQWTQLPALRGMKMFINMRLQENDLFVIGIGIEKCYDVCQVLDLETLAWRQACIQDSDHKPLELNIFVRNMQSRGYPVTRFLLCKNEEEEVVSEDDLDLE